MLGSVDLDASHNRLTHYSRSFGVSITPIVILNLETVHLMEVRVYRFVNIVQLLSRYIKMATKQLDRSSWW